MASIEVFPLSISGVQPPLNLLASLIGGASSLTNFTYPLDLGSNPNYGHAVTFTAVQQDTTSLESLLNNPLQSLTAQNLANQQNSGKSIGYISLYLPDTLNTTYNHDWSEVSLTRELPGATFFTGAAADVANLAKHGTDQDRGSFKNLFGAGTVGGLAGLVNSTLGGAVQNAIGVVQNPHLQLLYKGIGLREFQFEFLFTPSSSQEAQMVDKIITQFTYWSVPQISNAGGSIVSNNYLIPPQLFKINFSFLGSSGVMGAVSNFFNNIGTNILGSQLTAALSPGNVNASSGSTAKIFQIYNNCALTNINIDYAPNGWASFGDGYPVQTRMTLQFKETDIVSKNLVAPSQLNVAQQFLNQAASDVSESAAGVQSISNNMNSIGTGPAYGEGAVNSIIQNSNAF